MITISQSKIKSVTQTAQGESITQAAYNEIIQRLAFHKLSCTCGRHGDLVRHGYYNRSVKAALRSWVIRILRVRCKSCGKTHALLPESLVPYSSVTLKVHVETWSARSHQLPDRPSDHLRLDRPVPFHSPGELVIAGQFRCVLRISKTKDNHKKFI